LCKDIKEIFDDCSQCCLMFRWAALPLNVVINFFGMCFGVL
jgi:hypothetical protein